MLFFGVLFLTLFLILLALISHRVPLFPLSLIFWRWGHRCAVGSNFGCFHEYSYQANNCDTEMLAAGLTQYSIRFRRPPHFVIESRLNISTLSDIREVEALFRTEKQP
jgi:hypothetical protein